MRTIMKFTFSNVAAANKGFKDGSLQNSLKSVMDKFKPEAVYFYTNNGCRSGFMVFDMKDSSELPVIAEPLFINFNASVEFSPIMNAEDLQKGSEEFLKT